jgi:hypothetical protein
MTAPESENRNREAVLKGVSGRGGASMGIGFCKWGYHRGCLEAEAKLLAVLKSSSSAQTAHTFDPSVI